MRGAEARALALVAEDRVPSTLVPLAAAVLDVLHVWEVVVGAELRPLADVPVTRGLRAAAKLAVAVDDVRHGIHPMRRAESCLLSFEAVDWLAGKTIGNRQQNVLCGRGGNNMRGTVDGAKKKKGGVLDSLAVEHQPTHRTYSMWNMHIHTVRALFRVSFAPPARLTLHASVVDTGCPARLPCGSTMGKR